MLTAKEGLPRHIEMNRENSSRRNSTKLLEVALDNQLGHQLRNFLPEADRRKRNEENKKSDSKAKGEKII